MTVKERKDRIRAKPSVDKGKVDRRLAAMEALVRLIKGIAGELDDLEIETMVKAINMVLDTSDVSEEESTLALKLTGRQYSNQEAVVLEITSLMRSFDKRKELLKDSLTATKVAELLRTTRQTPHDRINNKSLLAVKDNGVWKFPSWQFNSSGADGVIDGLPEVLKALGGSEFTKLNWLTSPNPYLNSLTPVEALKQGQKAKVLTEAIALGAW
ncbi:hypothetical protein [Chlorogloea sp. CCALA 695]|uniref:hypothetical protein n=1 Tax=Chlorogloea sp. CCALA 695 TaxID=2107693 RepID=UPI000D051FBF|nr:hypothetical protein [Chlorogloea sp. CCALA 695]PSB30372.1 hypothetical protein C7B70_16345 [Chlorogloea sp. CCALA 695]